MLGNPILSMFNLYAIAPKFDRYSLAKILNHRMRTVLGCSLFFKLLWLYVCGPSDDAWSQASAIDGPYYVPENHSSGWNARMVNDHLSRGSRDFAADATGWDRSVPGWCIYGAIEHYFFFLIRGVPEWLRKCFASWVVDSLCVFPDGTVYQKHKGNPSGMPNTLRLNGVCLVGTLIHVVPRCVPSPLSPTYASLLKLVSLRICGDDSHLVELLGFIDEEAFVSLFMSLFGITMKVEGRTEYVIPKVQGIFHHSSFASRVSVGIMSCLDGVTAVRFYPLMEKPSKVIARITCHETAHSVDEALQDPIYTMQVAGVSDALVSYFAAMERDIVRDHSVEWLAKKFGKRYADCGRPLEGVTALP
jgi:hypothetical protein